MMNVDGILPLMSAGLVNAWIAAYGILTGIADIFGGIILLVIGVLIIIVIVAAAIVLLPAILVALLIWLLTGSLFYAGIVFVIVALISAVAMAGD